MYIALFLFLLPREKEDCLPANEWSNYPACQPVKHSYSFEQNANNSFCILNKKTT